MKNADIRETSQIIYHWKDRENSDPKIQVSSILSNFVKLWAFIKVKLWLFYHKHSPNWLSQVTPDENFENLELSPYLA